ncbi:MULTISPECIES: TetR/AcrR family transcriptional regulator [unclassified Curtobacterium]|uniref:TetR/AcrR family transcriptional regulator n=1 Tax=unclassified Curtobacterium TaxID=257496 RepID=UPI00082D5DCA|nr:MULTISPECIES: TetR/AcrR family transcriptional regulator [unclassified Curtobacterium]MBP1301151.1 AcrR family transcriptional regulator [Curtobacterium sp. 1310]MCM3505823.1 TetR/AcrR family transcriptional regulator [Curtobacterium sp. ODYSSEY 48 V2]MCM3522155.1 TetR/AcrR family transcriptional regulator [Curtobacterium sp. P97]MDB6426870.1 TetR/AcrR family transcriptional regulator [Curtobacterium sp. 20TX0008]MDP9735540.1 AcrR family transcriptional regulator [Curtobacterium sp. 260]
MSTTAAPEPVTAPCTLRERKKQQTRQALHDAALTLVSEHGLDGVTVEQICSDADVSPRTFFNYFTSKAHAALGLDTVEVPEWAATRFAEADGRLVDDLCVLIAATVPLSQDRRRMKELLVLRPEMAPMVMQWMAESRQSLLATVSSRTDEQTARTAVGLVLSALSEVAHRDTVGDSDELAVKLRTVVAEMGAIAAS